MGGQNKSTLPSMVKGLGRQGVDAGVGLQRALA